MKPFEWYLDDVRAEDKEDVVAHLAHKEISDNTLLIPYPYHDEDFEAWFAHKGRVFAIREKRGRLIGCIGFGEVGADDSKTAEMGYWLAKEYWGRGIMTQVIHQACEIAFEEYHFECIRAGVFLFNQRSMRCLEKNGFRAQRARETLVKNGQPMPTKVYLKSRPRSK